ncbi:MAG: transglutaminase domain-containing protein [Chitinophagaceae bacterium]|nr:transglutaminase domain-containing protein [Chitinophagaceae bacterium]
MKIKVYLLLVLLVGMQQLIAQTTPSQKIDEFFKQKADGFDIAYDNKDVKTYNSLLSEYLVLHENLPTNEKKERSYELSNIYYNLSCIYSLLDNKISAINSLKKAIDAGYNNYGHVQLDTDLDNIRKEKEFIVLNNKLKLTGDYLFILKKANKYNLSDSRPLPKFNYQSSDNPNLMALRKGFNLDSIAGQGNDVLKILNLLQWVHNLIPHDGNHDNPEVKNALSMINVCKKDDRGLNCRGLALVLNECYLAMGIKSRIVTCYPKDILKIDPDCHVINSVYSESLKKWLWIDPTFNAFVMNENGEMLSIEEVRERLINDKILILNPNANWNNKQTQTKEGYLKNYMAKNLYMLESPATSEYNMETHREGKTISYIKLLPLDYDNQKPDKVESDGKITVYKTNNPKVFWGN